MLGLMRRGLVAFYFVALLGSAQAQNIERISSAPPVSAQGVADLEARIRANPQDIESRLALLRSYAESAPIPPNDDPARRLARLDHILYLIDHYPEASAMATPLMYVAGARGAYANQDDHQVARSHWLAAVDSHPVDSHAGNSTVIVNAVRFLAVEDKSDAEDVLQKAMAADPENREIAANLGFLYAMEILRLDSLGLGAKPSSAGLDLAAHARAELDSTSNPIVLAGAGTAIPNLAMAASLGGTADPGLFELASSLSAKARQLAPGDPDIQGPMPLIHYFAAAREAQASQGLQGAAGRPGMPMPSSQAPGRSDH